MPIYDLYCVTCNNELKDLYVPNADKLPECCGHKMSKKVSKNVASGFPKGGLTLTNLSDKPIHFETKNQLRQYKREHNLELGALPND